MSIIFKDATRPLGDFILKLLANEAMTESEILRDACAVEPRTEPYMVSLALKSLSQEGKIAKDYDETYQLLRKP